MFLISKILQKMGYSGKHQIENEKPFKYLALTASILDELSCIFIDNKRFVSNIPNHTSMILTTNEVFNEIDKTRYGVCVVEKPRDLFFKIHNFLCSNENYSRPRYSTVIGENCNVSKHAVVAKQNVTIGNNVIIEEFSVIRENTIIGDNTIIRSGSKIGGTGFEFKRVNKEILPVTHIGGVVIGKNVELQYNSCVDKGVYPWDDTLIGNYCKIDSLVQIGHGVKLNDNIMIAANSCIGGRTIIGKNSWIGIGVIIINGVKIGANSNINIGSVVFNNIEPKSSVLGYPAHDTMQYGKIQFKLRELTRKK